MLPRGAHRKGGGRAKVESLHADLSSAAAASPLLHEQKNCSILVNDPVDAHPVRSPQAVHSAITRRIYDVDLVEIGTRGGDGMACFAQVTRSASAVEMDPSACKKLQARSLTLGKKGNRTFFIQCDRYQALSLDADVFTWWQQEPHLKNGEVLHHLRRQQHKGQIRAQARAILLFERGYDEDMSSFNYWQNFSQWIEEISFDEQRLCRKLYRSKPWFRKRAKGSYYVMGIKLADVPLIFR